jgi:hypothetical protein
MTRVEVLFPAKSEARRAFIARVGKVGASDTWPESDVSKLKEMWARGVLTKLIAHDLGRSVSSVKSKKRDLGLPDRHHRTGTVRKARVSLMLDDVEYDKIRRMAQYHRRSVPSYVRMLLGRDGAL